MEKITNVRRYAVVDSQGIVTDLFLWRDAAEPQPQEGCQVIQSDTARIGGAYANGVFSTPPHPASNELATQQAQAFQAQCTAALQQRLDNAAQGWGYDDIVSAASYIASGNPQFAAEARAMVDWRDATWTWGYATLAAIQAGNAALPASLDALLAKAPAAPERPSAS